MSSYSDYKKKEESSGPHVDVLSNVQFYQNILKKAEFSSEVAHEVGDSENVQCYPPFDKDRQGFDIYSKKRVKEWMYCSFTIGPRGARLMSYHITFHQIHREFKIQLCNVLNQLVRMGYLRRNDIPMKQDEWTELFGKESY